MAPNLLGHGWRRGSDYCVSALAEDLQPYFTNTSYDVIIGHSLGGPVVLALLPFLHKKKATTIIFVDAAFEIPETRVKTLEKIFLEEIDHPRTLDEYMAENPSWSQRDHVLRMLGFSMCDRKTVKGTFRVRLFRCGNGERLLTASAFVANRKTSHGLSVTCGKTSLPLRRLLCWYQIRRAALIVIWSTFLRV